MIKRSFPYMVILCVLLSITDTYSQDTTHFNPEHDSIIAHYDIFDDDQPAQITLIYDIKKFQKEKYEEKFVDAELIYHVADTIGDVHQNVRIKVRGKNRRDRCTFPPVWINIKKTDKLNVNLKETKKIKLVTHCGGSKAYESYVLKEFLAYKIYNILSPYSFRVRLVSIKYIDAGRKNKETESWAFLIEPELMLADRSDAFPFKVDKIGMKQTDSLWTDYMTIFQYMIGNSDYSVTGRHNVKLLKLKDPLKIYPIPVPYDFDYAGIVDAHYAIPGNTLGLESVTERYFLGPCRDKKDYQEVIDSISKKKEAIFNLINNFEYLNEKERKKILRYLDEFFTQSTKSRYIESFILSTCR